MAEIYQLEEYNVNYPQISYLAQELDSGRILACPANNGYSLVTHDRVGIKRLQRFFQKEKRLPVVLYKDIAQVAGEINLNQSVFKLIKKNSPSPCTFVLKVAPALASKIVYERRPEIGIKLPSEPIIAQLLDYSSSEHLVAFGAFDSSSEEFAVLAHELADQMSELDLLIIDYDRPVIISESTVVDCTVWPSEIIRQGDFELID